jgi:hypothetical protein
LKTGRKMKHALGRGLVRIAKAGLNLLALNDTSACARNRTLNFNCLADNQTASYSDEPEMGCFDYGKRCLLQGISTATRTPCGTMSGHIL